MSADKQIMLQGHMTHIHEALLELDEDSLWEHTCKYNGFESPADTFNINAEDCNKLMFYDPSAPDKGNQVLKKAKGGLKTLNSFKALKRFILHLRNNGKDINQIFWTLITHEEYLTFVCSPYNSNDNNNNDKNNDNNNDDDEEIEDTAADEDDNDDEADTNKPSIIVSDICCSMKWSTGMGREASGDHRFKRMGQNSEGFFFRDDQDFFFRDDQDPMENGATTMITKHIAISDWLCSWLHKEEMNKRRWRKNKRKKNKKNAILLFEGNDNGNSFNTHNTDSFFDASECCNDNENLCDFSEDFAINVTTFAHVSSFLLSTKHRCWIRPTKSPSCPRTWMLLRHFMLSPWFVPCNCGASFNFIIPLQVHINTRCTAIDLLLPQHRKPPDPQCIVKIRVEDPNVNSVESTTCQINQSLTCTISKCSFNQH